jgi:hypothetical protein
VTSRGSGSSSTLPITWPPAQMHDSDYRNVCGLKLIHDAEWKSLNEAPPDRAAREQAARIRTGNNFSQGVFDLPNEVRTQARGASFVEPGGRDKFALGQGVEDESHRSAARAFFNTFPAEIPVTLPLLSPAERRFISSNHACSACGSTASSRLVMSRSASRARERAGSFNASSSIFLRAMLIALPCIKSSSFGTSWFRT